MSGFQLPSEYKKIDNRLGYSLVQFVAGIFSLELGLSELGLSELVEAYFRYLEFLDI